MVNSNFIQGEKGMKLSQYEFKQIQSSKSGVRLAVFGMVMMGFGIYRGEISVVLEKAINICMECIGIG